MQKSTDKRYCPVHLKLYEGEKLKKGYPAWFEPPYFNHLVIDTANYSETEAREWEMHIKEVFTAEEMKVKYR